MNHSGPASKHKGFTHDCLNFHCDRWLGTSKINKSEKHTRSPRVQLPHVVQYNTVPARVTTEVKFMGVLSSTSCGVSWEQSPEQCFPANCNTTWNKDALLYRFDYTVSFYMCSTSVEPQSHNLQSDYLFTPNLCARLRRSISLSNPVSTGLAQRWSGPWYLASHTVHSLFNTLHFIPLLIIMRLNFNED